MSDGAKYRIVVGDALRVLATMPPDSAQCCVTSPPYWGLRDYECEGQLGLERTPEEYVARLVEVFAEVRRALRDDGTLWLNLGDTYAGGGRGGGGSYMKDRKDPVWQSRSAANGWRPPPDGLKPKDLVGIPWRVAFALQADGWYLRSDIIWAKPNPMPESVTDRPTKSHEYVFLLSKSSRYYYDAEALMEPALHVASGNVSRHVHDGTRGRNDRLGASVPWSGTARNRRSVWSIATEPFPGSHFAVMPRRLAELCILAGSKKGDTVLDPFAGSGTVGVMCRKHERRFVGIEINSDYARMAEGRVDGVDLTETATEDEFPLFGGHWLRTL